MSRLSVVIVLLALRAFAGTPVKFNAPQRDFPARDSGTFVAQGDLNGDGIPDLLVTNYSGYISVLLGRGDGTFNKPIQNFFFGQANYVVLADFNGDGKLDAAVTNTPPDAFLSPSVSM